MFNSYNSEFFENTYIAMGLAFLISYLIGNISPSTLIGKRRDIDIKKEGSGNAGTTNALRVLGKKAALITLIVDILKGTIAVLIGGLLGGSLTASIAVIGVFLGHVLPIVYGFKGGKGVATAFGALLGYNPLMAGIALLIVIISVIISRRMSVGSLVGALTFPAVSYICDKNFLIAGTTLATIIIYKHKANIKRLLEGKEPKLGEKSNG